MKKIDFHAHTTKRPVHTALRSASLDTLAKKMKEHNIEKSVVLATYFPHKSSGVSNFRLLDWIDGREEFVMFGSLDFEHYFYQGYNELAELAGRKKIKGIKIYTSYQNVDFESDNFWQVLNLAKQHKLPMMFHAGYSYQAMSKLGRMAVTEILKASDLEALARENPEMNFVASHMAKPFFDDLVLTIKRNQNIYTDVSGLIDSKNDRKDIPGIVEEVKKFAEQCGTRQLLFGTDFPVQTHEDSVYFVEEGLKGFSYAEKSDVYYNNAWRLLR
jgi:predicted TIM-barrel fold metal-dependent hydrolase